MTRESSPLQTISRIKLHRPRTMSNLLVRPQLLDRMERALQVPVTLVSAPAGFGKSTLVSQWLDSHDGATKCSIPSAWLSLDPQDGDLIRFITHFVAAIRLQYPFALTEIAAELYGPTQPNKEALLVQLINELEDVSNQLEIQYECGLVMVLDDFDSASTVDVNDLVSFLLLHPVPSFHLILISRKDPALQLSRLRARNQLLEIRSRDLRLSPVETIEFLRERVNPPLSAQELDYIVEQTEGWLAGLQMARLVLDGIGNRETGVARSMEAYNRFAMDFLIQEVLSRQPLEVQDSLLRLSVVNQFCEGLAEALGVRKLPDGASFIGRLEAINLFVIGLDAEGVWYRYHRLFKNLLERQIRAHFSEAEVADLHRRAAQWLSAHGNLDEAVSHALKSNDVTCVRQVFIDMRVRLFEEEDFHLLRHTMQRIPRAVIDESPALLMTQGWLEWSRNLNLPALKVCADCATALLDAHPGAFGGETALRGEIACALTVATYAAQDMAECRRQRQFALDNTPVECHFFRSHAWIHGTGALYALGHGRDVLAELDDARRIDGADSPADSLRAYVGRCFILWAECEIDELLETADESERTLGSRRRVETSAWIHYFRAAAAFLRNDLERAVAESDALVHDPGGGGSALATIHSYPILAFSQFALGRQQLAFRTIDEGLSSAAVRANPRLKNHFMWARTELKMRMGKISELPRALESLEAQPMGQHDMMFYNAGLTRARLLIAMDGPENLATARKSLEQLIAGTAKHRNLFLRMKARSILAVLEDREGNHDRALEELRQVLEVAHRHRLVRFFCTGEPRMAALLAELGRSGVYPEFVAEVVEACAGTPVVESSGKLPEALTDRELQVLSLLADRYTNKEIAHALVISTLTVKRHTLNIYGKLQVNGRRDAVERAIALGILPQPTREKFTFQP